MLQTVLFIPYAEHYLVGDPDTPRPWAGDNPDALAALHTIVNGRGSWCAIESFGGSLGRTAMHQRLHNAAKGLAHVSPLLTGELRRGLTSKRVEDDQGNVRILWRHDPSGALAYIETRPYQTTP
jgi:hypothetical protein